MGIRVGTCGVGAFSESFIPLFRAHPGVEQVILYDLDAEKLRSKADKFSIPQTCASLDDLCRMDAIAILTQHWLHGPQAVQALRASTSSAGSVITAVNG